MPTFVVLKNGEQVFIIKHIEAVLCFVLMGFCLRQVDRVEGFREASIRAMIAKHRTSSAEAAGVVKKGD